MDTNVDNRIDFFMDSYDVKICLYESDEVCFR